MSEKSINTNETEATFEDLGVSPRIIRALDKKGFKKPTPIQQKAIPLLLKNNVNVVGKAKTGTGKTAAFGIPILQNITEKKTYVQAIILTPTRELALQVSDELKTLGGIDDLTIIPIYGGQPIPIQLRLLSKGADIVVGTPGRVIDMIDRRKLDIRSVSYFVLDEADEMLNMGFIDDIKNIMSHVSEDKRIICFSATMPKQIMGIVQKYMGDYEMVSVEPVYQESQLIEQIAYEVPEYLKFETLCRIIDTDPNFYGLVFCGRKDTSDSIGLKLEERGYDVEIIHGDILQEQRTRIMERFKNRKVKILVATDVAARGVDISELTHVVNYDLPQDPESYTHRIGRTGRAGKKGTAVTIYTPKEFRKFSFIRRIANADVVKKRVPDANFISKMRRQKILYMIEEKDPYSFYYSNEGKPFIDFAHELMEAADTSAEEVLVSLLSIYHSKDILPVETDFEIDNKFEQFYKNKGGENKNTGDSNRSRRGRRRNSAAKRQAQNESAQRSGRSRQSRRNRKKNYK